MTVKSNKKIHVFEVLIFFENLQVLSVSRNSLQTPSLDQALFEKFHIAKFNYLSERPNKVKETFWNIFD